MGKKTDSIRKELYFKLALFDFFVSFIIVGIIPMTEFAEIQPYVNMLIGMFGIFVGGIFMAKSV